MGYIDSTMFWKLFYPDAWEQEWVECETEVAKSHFAVLPQDTYSSNS